MVSVSDWAAPDVPVATHAGTGASGPRPAAPPPPAPPVLRPRSVFELLDEAFDVYRRYLGPILAVSLLVLGPAVVLSIVLLRDTESGASLFVGSVDTSSDSALPSMVLVVAGL